MKISNPTAIIGENAAVEYLEKKGYDIIERNYRKGYGEIDIIAVKEKTLVFVEVKTRTSSQFGTPFEAITPRKLQDIIKTSQVYVLFHPHLPKLLRIDAISVLLNNGEKIGTIEHIENISLA